MLSRMDPLEERAEWLRWRKHGIGGSDIAALLNMSRFATPTSVYYDKLGLVDDDEGNEAMLWGRLLEGPIGAEFADRTGLVIIGEQIVAANSERPHERATLDLLVGESPTTNLDDAIGVGEIKNVSDYSWDAIPDEYAVQVQWQLGICELAQAWLAVLHGGRRLVIYPVEFEPAVFDELRNVADHFWHHNVLGKNPPPVDGDDATTEALKDAYRSLADGSTVEFDEELEHIACEWLVRKELVKAVTKRAAHAANELRAALAAHTIGTRDGVELVTWKPQATAGTFDREGLERDYPLIAAKYRGPKGTARVLRETKHLKQKAGMP